MDIRHTAAKRRSGAQTCQAGTRKVPELVSRMASLTPADLGAP